MSTQTTRSAMNAANAELNTAQHDYDAARRAHDASRTDATLKRLKSCKGIFKAASAKAGAAKEAHDAALAREREQRKKKRETQASSSDEPPAKAARAPAKSAKAPAAAAESTDEEGEGEGEGEGEVEAEAKGKPDSSYLAKYKALNQEYGRKCDVVIRMRGERDALKTERDALKTERDELTARNRDLSTSLKDVEAKRVALANSNRQHMLDVQDLESQLEALRAQQATQGTQGVASTGNSEALSTLVGKVEVMQGKVDALHAQGIVDRSKLDNDLDVERRRFGCLHHVVKHGELLSDEARAQLLGAFEKVLKDDLARARTSPAVAPAQAPAAQGARVSA